MAAPSTPKPATPRLTRATCLLAVVGAMYGGCARMSALTPAPTPTTSPTPPTTVAETGTDDTSLPVIRQPTPQQVADRQWQNRLLLVFADEEADPRLLTQRRLLGPSIAALRERDVLLIEVVGDDPLRQSLAVDKSGFHVLLVGKDGGVKLRAQDPVAPERINAIIDAMPMRQAEMRRRP